MYFSLFIFETKSYNKILFCFCFYFAPIFAPVFAPIFAPIFAPLFSKVEKSGKKWKKVEKSGVEN
jgi:hypothetical protein